MSDIAAFGRTTNAQLMRDCAALGYLPEPVLDATYGLGRFWRDYVPVELTTNDLWTPADNAWDFTQLPCADRSYAAVVFDPPYKLNGTSTGRGPSVSDAGYGVAGAYMSIGRRHGLIGDGISECGRVAGRFLLVKCQDQVSSGAVQWQTRLFADRGETCGFRLVDMLHVSGARAQPEGRRQVHARRNYSTLLVLRRE